MKLTLSLCALGVIYTILNFDTNFKYLILVLIGLMFLLKWREIKAMPKSQKPE
jgi:hypothetical protein